MNIQHLAGRIGNELKKHAPTILTGVSVIGVAATAYLASRAGYKAATHIVEHEITTGEVVRDPKTKVQLAWRYYIPPLSVGMATVACMITSNVLSVKRQTVLLGAYALAEQSFATYRQKIVENFGEDDEQTIHEIITEDATQQTLEESTLVRKDDQDIFVDAFSGQDFLSTIPKVEAAQNAILDEIEARGFAKLNYFYQMIGARTTEMGDDFGWNSDRPIDVVVTPLVTQDKRAGFGIGFRQKPVPEYYTVR